VDLSGVIGDLDEDPADVLVRADGAGGRPADFPRDEDGVH
jgi:hypothetical protein